MIAIITFDEIPIRPILREDINVVWHTMYYLLIKYDSPKTIICSKKNWEWLQCSLLLSI